MAEESVTLPDISGGVYSRRGSTGKLTSSKGGEKVVPNYLRASTGSCHDFCKFGHKDASEEKERRPFLRRGMSKPPDGHNHNDPDIQIFVPSTVRSEKNKGSLSLLSKSADCSNSDALMAAGLSRRKSSVPAGLLRKSLDYTNVSKVEKNKMSPNRRLTGSFDSKLSGLIGASSSKAKIITSSREEKKKSPPTILRTSPDQSLKKGKSTSQPKLDNPSNRASQSAEALSLSEKLGSSLKLKSNNNAGRVVSAGRSNTNFGTGQKSSSVPRKVAPLRKLQMPSPKVSLSSPKRNVSGGLARALSSPRVSLSPRSSLAGIAGLNTAKNRGGKVTSGLMKRNETEQAKTENKIKKKVASNVQHKIEDKTTKKVANKQRMNKQVKEVSPDMVQEKTLYVIKMDTEDKHLESGLNERLDGDTETETSLLPDSSMKPLSIPGCSSSSSSLTNEDEDEESEYSLTDDEELDSLDIEEQKKWNRRKGVVRSESQDPQPVKLRFRRGKVIEIKSENEGPRKLKFRRRSLGKDQNAKEVERRMSYRDRGEEGEVKKGGDDSEKVVLRHQDVDGKKDGQGGLLFNNVIEETASKLAETRKSKVKALVGAFETVISLQDGKPSSGNVNLGLFPAALT